ncbi:MAG: cache domain-containing protein, partial [Syntrophobacteraceae bacterium]
MSIPANRTFLNGRLRNLPLRYRLIVPFFLLAFTGTTTLVFLSMISQNTLIREGERDRLLASERGFDYTIDLHGRWAVSLAAGFASSPEVAAALAEKDRLRLIKLSYPAYLFMKDRYKISQFNFHTIPPRNFLRLQRLYEFGDALDYRRTIADAVLLEKETYGLETGLTGYGIRGVVPVWHEGKLAGTMEIGFSLGSSFLEVVKVQFGVQASLLFPGEDGVFRSTATTFSDPFERRLPQYGKVFKSGRRELIFQEVSGVPYAMLIGAVRDYRGRTVALVEFGTDRTPTLQMIQRYRLLMLWIGILGLFLSVWAIYLISAYFTRPIGKMVDFARSMTLGEDMHRFEGAPSGELAILAKALDDMLASLLDSQEKIRNYAENLEQMVHTRTRALLESEEKYRTLVENVPLVVYRLLGDGRTVFINQFVQDLMGLPHRQILGSADFWKERVFEDDRARIWPLMERCLREGFEFNGEYRIRHVSGRMLYVMDHAQPILDEEGRVDSVDGFMLNVTDRHALEQQLIQTEEL